MYVITGYLYKEDKLLLRGMLEDLENFVEELKALNKKYVDRRNVKIVSTSGELLKEWKRK